MSLSLADALARVDIPGFYESRGIVIAGKPTHSRQGLEYACSCFNCGGTDRASFWPESGPGRYACIRGCGAHASSVYWACRDILHMTHLEALAELGIDPSEIDFAGNQSTPKLPLFLLKEEMPSQKWQEAASAFLMMAERYLWSAKGESARAYLHSRGFNDDTLHSAHIGLCPDWFKAPLEEWGLDASQLGREDDPQIKIPKGLTIPWYAGGALWKIQLRRPEPGPDGKKYKEILGSSDCLYNGDAIQPGKPVLLTESELDALSASQEASDLVACVATGSASKGLSSRHLSQVLRASFLLQCFDTDEAGEKGAAEWLSKLTSEQARRWKPWAHDINDMLKTGLPVRLWIESGLKAAQPVPPAQFTEEQQARQLLQELEAEGASLLFQPEINNWHIGHPEHWSEEYAHSWGRRVVALDMPLRRILSGRAA